MSIPNMMPIEEAAKHFLVSEHKIKNWIRSYKVTSSNIGKTMFVDKNCLSRIIELNLKLSRYDEYLAEELRIREEEITQILLQIDDLTFVLKSIKKIAPLYLALINEMALLIPKELPRTVFIDVTRKMNLSDIAKQYKLSYDEVCTLYNSALSCINHKLGFIIDYRKIMANKELEIRRLKIAERNLKEEALYLKGLLKQITHEDIELNPDYSGNEIPLKVVELLCLRIEDVVTVDTRTHGCLVMLSLETIEDLLRFIKQNGFDKLLKTKYFGKLSLEKFKTSLIQAGIIDESENSYLFQYIS